jgi:uncharacterized protein YuzE
MTQSYFKLNNNKVATSDQIADDVIVDYDVSGAIVGLEFLSGEAAAKRDIYLAMAAKPSPVRLRVPVLPGKAVSAA